MPIDDVRIGQCDQPLKSTPKLAYYATIMLVRDCIMYLNDNFYAGCYFKLGLEPWQEI